MTIQANTITAAAAAAAVAIDGIIPVGTLVDIHPPRVDGFGGSHTRGVVYTAERATYDANVIEYRVHVETAADPRGYITAFRSVSNSADMDLDTVTIAPAAESHDGVVLASSLTAATPAAPTPVPAPVHLIPRNALDAITRARALRASKTYLPENTHPAIDDTTAALQDLARFLPGGELQDIAHEHALQASLCGEYEAIVCPTFGWLPRNGQGSSMARRCTTFGHDADVHEAQHEGRSPLYVLTSWLDRYARGGVANTAVCDHAATHLEEHKVDGANELLETVLGWKPIEQSDNEYDVEVELTRTRTVVITERQTVTVSVTASDHDTAEAMVNDGVVDPWDEASDYSWYQYDTEEDGEEELVGAEVQSVTLA